MFHFQHKFNSSDTNDMLHNMKFYHYSDWILVPVVLPELRTTNGKDQ